VLQRFSSDGPHGRREVMRAQMLGHLLQVGHVQARLQERVLGPTMVEWALVIVATVVLVVASLQ
jgi:hypothetical protein